MSPAQTWLRAPRGNADAEASILASADALLDQAEALLVREDIADALFVSPSRVVPGSSVGQHLRHVHEHYRILAEALQAAPASGGPVALDYDNRGASRHTAFETDRRAALAAFRALRARLHAAVGGRGDMFARPVQLAAVTPEHNLFGSTVGRELWFCTLHAIHHFALLKAILIEMNVEVGPQFGVAPSTLKRVGVATSHA
ncbi:hypothetical protein MSPP1_002786 [Malassezia sp. CBS 17886]|nr:hypothetical protein MSPP1_002786 [Malassezia sp. CBS 17886]